MKVVCDNGITEHEGEMYVEASSLGLRPGEWPEQFLLRGEVWDQASSSHSHEYDLLHVNYVSPKGQWLKVIND